MNEKREAIFLRVSDIFRNAEPVTLAQDVRRKRVAAQDKAVLDASTIRRQQDWSFLAGQVVGAEERTRNASV